MGDLKDKLTRESPDTDFERFARNFRNMGVVKDFHRGRSDDTLIVTTTDRGMNLTPVRDKGHDFHVQDTSIVEEDGSRRVRHVLQYRP